MACKTVPERSPSPTLTLSSGSCEVLKFAAVLLVLRHKTYLYRSHGRNETFTFDNATDR